MAKRIGHVLITYELLAQMMGLDSDHKITAIVPQTASDVSNQRFGAIMTGPSLPETPEGGEPMAFVWSEEEETGRTRVS